MKYSEIRQEEESSEVIEEPVAKQDGESLMNNDPALLEHFEEMQNELEPKEVDLSTEIQAIPVIEHTAEIRIALNERDGVFSNMAATPERKIYEEIEPPSYHDIIVDPSPDYFVNCVDETGEVLVEGSNPLLIVGYPLGNYFIFFLNVFISMTFDILGFFLTTMMATTQAARFGSQCGLGLTFVRYGILLKHRAETAVIIITDPNRGIDEEISRREWSAMFITFMGLLILVRATVEFIRLRRLRAIIGANPLQYGI